MRLLVLDLEGTIFRSQSTFRELGNSSSVWLDLATALGPEALAAELETHEHWKKGLYTSYMSWMEATITIHQTYGLTRSTFERVISQAVYNEGVVDTLNAIDRRAWELVLISGGFRELAARAQSDLQIKHAFAACEYLFGADDKLRSFNLLPCDFEGKLGFVHVMLEAYRLSKQDWVFVGDGRNDIPIALRAPLAIGYRPHGELRAVVHHVLERFEELPQYLQG